jgi:lipoprotein NlpD
MSSVWMLCILFLFFQGFGDMMNKNIGMQWWGVTAVCAVIVSGCASTRGDFDVPVIDHTGTGAVNHSINSSLSDRNTAVIEVPEGGHMVKKGDTLYNIATRYGLTPRELAEMNQLTDPNHINLGQVLRVNRKPSTLSRSVDVPAATRSEWNGDGRSSSRTRELNDSGIEVRPLSSDGGVDSTRSSVEGTSKGAAGTKGGSSVIYPVNSASKQPYSEETWQKTQDASEERLDFVWPATGKISQGFSNTNKGIDINGKVGQPVLASAPGKVVYVGSKLRGYGNLVILKHGRQFLTTYAHNREILVKEGDEVNRGQKIAEMGSTDSDQVKLHFELRKLGKPVDPTKYLPER